MMDRGTVRNMYGFIPKIKFEKLLRLVGFVIRIYHDPRPPERQIRTLTFVPTLAIRFINL